MQAIQHIIGAAQADSLNELKDELASARQALTALEEAKLAELSDAIQGERSKIGYSPMSAETNEIPRKRYAIRDNPQA